MTLLALIIIIAIFILSTWYVISLLAANKIGAEVEKQQKHWRKKYQ